MSAYFILLLDSHVTKSGVPVVDSRSPRSTNHFGVVVAKILVTRDSESARATTCDNTESKRAQGPSEQSGLGATSHETETVGPTPKVSPVLSNTHYTK